MVQRGQNFGLALKARESLIISTNRCGRTLIATARFKLMSVAL
jgi:hypothetical protein